MGLAVHPSVPGAVLAGDDSDAPGHGVPARTAVRHQADRRRIPVGRARSAGARMACDAAPRGGRTRPVRYGRTVPGAGDLRVRRVLRTILFDDDGRAVQ